MLIKGDLVRIPQGAVMLQYDSDSDVTLPIRTMRESSMAIVIDDKTYASGIIKVLVNDELLLVSKNVIKLVGSK